MIRPPLRTRLFSIGLLFGMWLFAGSAAADVDYLIDQLSNADDFRVRTQAALALGASDSKAAVEPLCSALDDTSDSVRSAAGAALGKLKNAKGLACLKAHMSESSASVHAVIERSVKLLEQRGKSDKPPPPGPSDTFYVAIGPVTDKTGRGDTSVGDVVRETIQQKLLSLSGYAIAPAGETAPAAKKVLKKHKLKGFFLMTRVEPVRSVGDELVVEVSVTMWTYPGKALQGSFSPKLRMQGASPGDRESEDNLVKMAIESAIESFARQTAAMN